MNRVSSLQIQPPHHRKLLTPRSLRRSDSFLSIRSDSKLALRFSQSFLAKPAQRDLFDPLTPEELEYERRNSTMENLIRRLDKLLKPVLIVLEESHLSESILPKDIRSSLANKSTAAHHAARLPNSVDDLLRQVHKLQQQLISLRRDFALDACYCTWADTCPTGDAADISDSRAINSGIQPENTYLDIILTQFLPPHGSGQKRQPTGGISTAKTDSVGFVVPLKRAELYEKAFNMTLARVLHDYKDCNRCRAAAERALGSKSGCNQGASDVVRKRSETVANAAASSFNARAFKTTKREGYTGNDGIDVVAPVGLAGQICPSAKRRPSRVRFRASNGKSRCAQQAGGSTIVARRREFDRLRQGVI